MTDWIDHIVARPALKVVSSQRTGMRQLGDLYPSDHAGIVATLRLR